MKLINQVVFDKIKKDLKRLPYHVLRKLQKWAEQVEMLGIWEIRKVPGYHDEPLTGDRKGQRSIQLSKSYRAIYMEERDGNIRIDSHNRSE